MPCATQLTTLHLAYYYHVRTFYSCSFSCRRFLPFPAVIRLLIKSPQLNSPSRLTSRIKAIQPHSNGSLIRFVLRHFSSPYICNTATRFITENGSGDGTAPPAPPPKPKKTKTYNSSSSSSSSPSSSSSSSCIYNHNKPHAHAHLHLHDDDFNNSPSIQEQTPSFHDVNVPPVPTVMMPTSGLSSPMTTPMQSPANAANFEFLGANDLHLKDDGLTSQAQWSESYSASLPHVPSDQYPQLLQDQIRKQAKAASVDKANSQFARLYKMAQTPKISKKIQAILAKKDMQQVEKVEAIASLLRVHVAR